MNIRRRNITNKTQAITLSNILLLLALLLLPTFPLPSFDGSCLVSSILDNIKKEPVGIINPIIKRSNTAFQKVPYDINNTSYATCYCCPCPENTNGRNDMPSICFCFLGWWLVLIFFLLLTSSQVRNITWWFINTTIFYQLNKILILHIVSFIIII